MASPDNGAKGSGDGGDGEEFRELSEFLGHQRMQYDELRHVYEAKKKMLSEIEKECRHLENLTYANKGQKVGFEEKVKTLNEQIAETKTDIDTWTFRCQSYNHVKNRLVNDKIRMDKRIEEMKVISQEAERECGNVQKMTIKQKQLRNLLERKRRSLEFKLEENRERRMKQLTSAKSGLTEQLRMQDRKESREKRRRQIALEVAGDLGVEEEKRLKKLYAEKKMYSGALNRKMEKNAAHTNALQKGFDQIKSATGFADLNEIVEKFLTRDKTYAALEKASAEMEQAIEEATSKNEQLSRKLSSLQLEDLSGQGKRNLYKDIDDKDAKVKEARKICNDHKNKAHKSRMTLQNIRQCIGKLNDSLTSKVPAANNGNVSSRTNLNIPSPSKLPSMIKKIEKQVALMLEELSRSLNLDGQSGLQQSGSGKIRSTSSRELDDSTSSVNQSIAGAGTLSKNRAGGQQKQASIGSKQVSDVLFNSIMAVEPDISPRNIRVAIDGRSPTPTHPNPKEKSNKESRNIVVDEDDKNTSSSLNFKSKIEGPAHAKHVEHETTIDADYEEDVMSRRDIKKLGAQYIQSIANKEKMKLKQPHENEKKQNRASERLMQGRSSDSMSKKEVDQEPWNIAKGEKAIALNLDDPFASKAKELQDRRLRQRTGVLEYDQTHSKKQPRGRRHSISKKENQTRQPHPPKKVGAKRRSRRRTHIK